jgi:hypothetical protein
MRNLTTLSLITATILGLSGCGGGSSSANNTNTSHTGFVGDGYIEGAYVCHDSNNNLNCLDETYATTAANGSFILSNYDSTQDLLVQIPVGAVDNGPFVNGSTTPRPFANQTWYYYPAEAAPANGPIFVGPLSTLVFAQIQTVPGISVNDATTAVANTLGINSATVLSNYIENNSTEGNNTHFVAELVGATLTNTSSTATSNNTDIQNVLSNSSNISNTASNNNPNTYDTIGYNGIPNTTTQANGTTVATALMYTPVSDVCNDLTTGTYFAFEEWDTSIGNGTPNREHKTLYMKTDANTGSNVLNIREDVDNNNAWSIEQHNSSTEHDYLQHINYTIVDMTQVNATTPYTKPIYDVLFPAVNTACNGSNATFDANGILFKLYVSGADINGLNGANLPQGPSVNSILSNVTFGAGDKLYKASVSLQNDVYLVDKGQSYQNGIVYPTNLKDYTVYNSTFTPLSNGTTMNTFVQTLNNSLVVHYDSSSDYEKFTITSTPASNNTGTVDFTKVENGTPTTTSMSYEIETHNAQDFLVIKNYKQFGYDLFIGKINSINSTSLVYGTVSHAGAMFYLTQGGFQDGDIMDDIMLNTSARDKVITQLNTQAGINIATPTLP